MPNYTAESSGDEDDGHIYGRSYTYADARSTSYASYTGRNDLYVGQETVDPGPRYHVHRSFLSFDTSAIPDDATISAASLYVRARADNSTTDFNVVVYHYDWTGPLGTTREANFDGAYGGSATLEGTLRDTASGWVTDTWYNMAVATARISKTGYTRYAIVSEEDVNNSTPTDDEFVDIHSAETSGKEPYLSVTYTAPVTGTHQVKWDLGGTVTGTHQLKWDLAGIVTGSHQVKWDLLAKATGSHQVKWDLAGGWDPASHEEIILTLPDATIDLDLPDSAITLSLPDSTITLDSGDDTMQTLEYVKGDAGPTLTATIKQNGSVVDLSGGSVVGTFKQRLVGASSDKFSVAVGNRGSDGTCTVTFTSAALDTAGEYLCEIQFTGLAGGTQTTRHFFMLRVRVSNA